MRIYLSIVPGIDEAFENEFKHFVYTFISNKLNHNESNKRIEINLLADSSDNVEHREDLISACDMGVLVSNWLFDEICKKDKEYITKRKIPNLEITFKRTPDSKLHFKGGKIKYAKLAAPAKSTKGK